MKIGGFKLVKEYINECDEPCVLEIDVGFRRFGQQDPYFSVTAELYDRARRIPGEPYRVHHGTQRKLWLGSFGPLDDHIRKRAPELEPLVRWHLFSVPVPLSRVALKEGGPLHYFENPIYWFSKLHKIGPFGAEGRRPGEPDPLEAFKSAVVFGAVEGDEVPECPELPQVVLRDSSYAYKWLRRSLRPWLAKRHGTLFEVFKKDMSRFGIDLEVLQ